MFANVLLVDEVNRASPRTQAALLEPMEEHQVTIDGATHRCPSPFFLVATENPFGHAGTFPLPDSQLDRFAMVCTIGRPGREAEREILSGGGGVEALDDIAPVTTPAELATAMAAVRHVHCAHSVLDYVLDVADATRNHPGRRARRVAAREPQLAARGAGARDRDGSRLRLARRREGGRGRVARAPHRARERRRRRGRRRV